MLSKKASKKIINIALSVAMYVAFAYIVYYLAGFAWDLGVLLYGLISETEPGTIRFLGFVLAVVVAIVCYVYTDGKAKIG